ncbi:MAG: helix-turn-helix transcriptional regulator [Alphaproteobacteria bacterium]|nr:helix-turn-helix transcriptional regulator [Alphaproteobacteria bacterium SS10]
MSETIEITRAEYDQLVEARDLLEDLRALDEADSRDGVAMPAEVVDRYIAGENPLRIVREWRGLSQSALARQSGVNRVQIVQIEGGGNASVTTFAKLANALDVQIDDVVEIIRDDEATQ